jgi:flagellar basal-body rod protein FlgC
MTLQDSFSIATTGLDTHASRLQVHAGNIANVTTPNYVRKIPVLMEDSGQKFEDILARIRHNGLMGGGAGGIVPSGVSMHGVVLDTTPAKKIYNPDHPAADKDGYVTMSNTNMLADMADAMVSSKVYEANLSVISVVKQMANKAIEIGRGQ